LEVLVLLWPTRAIAKDHETVINVTDERFCIDVCSDAVANWVGECRGGDHFWARADEFIAKKKLGKVAGMWTMWTVHL
jgi:hypothetical protein